MQPGRFSRIHFQHDLGFIGLGKKLAYEFRQMHGLDPPIRILLSGPPGSGKTELAKMLAEHYGAHHLTVRLHFLLTRGSCESAPSDFYVLLICHNIRYLKTLDFDPQ